MIRGRGDFYRAFGPAGFFPAGRFALRRFTSAPRRHTWSRIVLRWRLPRTRLRSVQTRIAAPTAPLGNAVTKSAGPRSRVSYFQHFQLHFVLARSDRSQRPWIPVFASPVDLPQERTGLDRRPNRAANTTLRRQAGNANPTLTVVPGLKGPASSEFVLPSPPRVSLPTDARSRGRVRTARPAPLPQFDRQGSKWSPIVRQFMSSAGHGQSRQIAARTPKFRLTTQIEEVTALRRRTVRTWEYRRQKLLLPQLEMAAVPPRRSADQRQVATFAGEGSVAAVSYRNRQVARFGDEKGAELVWRRASSSPAKDEKVERESTGSFGTRTQTSSRSENQQAPDVARLVERAATKQMTQLDPVLLDRLTDNVISRVEKRIKIERQRRGL